MRLVFRSILGEQKRNTGTKMERLFWEFLSSKSSSRSDWNHEDI
jgi:hypothetical protein